MTPSIQGHKISIQTKHFLMANYKEIYFKVIFTIYEINLHTNETELINR